MNFKALTGSIILRRFYYVRPLGFEFSNPDGLHTPLNRLCVFSACRIEDSFVSLTALTPQRRHLIVRLYGLSVLKALQAYTPLTRFRSCGYLAFVRNVIPVTHRLDYPTSLLLCCALWASSSRTPTGCTSAYAFYLPAIWLATSSAKLSCLFSRPSPNT